MDKMVEGIEMYVVYKNPLDYPGKFVVRRFIGLTPDKKLLVIADSLELAREVMEQKQLYNLGRQPNDDPAIFEVWI